MILNLCGKLLACLMAVLVKGSNASADCDRVKFPAPVQHLADRVHAFGHVLHHWTAMRSVTTPVAPS